MRHALQLLVSILAIGSSASTQATSTICSNPARARVLSTAIVMLPSDAIGTLERRFAIIAPQVGMETWGTSVSDRTGKVERQTLGLQSPQVSVSIKAKWQPGQRFATISVERTCYSDNLEPWRGYWWGTVSGLEKAGYLVRPAFRRKVR
jgi:hypothetical protein